MLFLDFEQNKPIKNSTTIDYKNRKNEVFYPVVFNRLVGNTNTSNKPWGTIAVNDLVNFNDFTDTAVTKIKNLDVIHIWYTGVPHYALVNDYKDFGISKDDPDVVKGDVVWQYAIKDYCNVDIDLALYPANKLQRFESVLVRTHKNRLKILINIVPNHVAQKYHRKANPKGGTAFGANDGRAEIVSYEFFGGCMNQAQ